MNEEAIMIEHGIGKQTKNYDRIIINPTTQVEEVYKILRDRNLEVINPIIDRMFIMENKMIIESTEQYIKEKKLENIVFDQINHIQFYK